MKTASTSARSPRPWPVDSIDAQRWQQGSNQAIVTILGPRVIGLELIGSVSADALEVIEPCLTRFLDYCPGDAHLFWDSEWLDSHDGVLRDRILAIVRSRRTRWSMVHVLFRSALVGVTVTAASLALGGSVKGYRDHLAFRTAVDRALGNGLED